MSKSEPGGNDQWVPWTMKAVLAAGAVFGIGMLLLGLPGAIALEIVTGLGMVSKLPPDSTWPLAITISNLGALVIVPASLVMRFMKPASTGWWHVHATALLTIFGTLLVAALVARTQAI